MSALRHLIVTPVGALAEKYGAAVFIVAHRRKATGPRADDLVLGSKAFTGVARVTWHLTHKRGEKHRKLLLPGKNNLAAEGDGLAFSIVGKPVGSCSWERDPVTLNADDALAEETSNGPEPEALTAAETWLQATLGDMQEHLASELQKQAEDAGLKWRTVQRASKAMRVIWQRSAWQGKTIWRLPKPAPTTPPPVTPTPATASQLGVNGAYGATGVFDPASEVESRQKIHTCQDLHSRARVACMDAEPDQYEVDEREAIQSEGM